jgi:hypothetical protein
MLSFKYMSSNLDTGVKESDSLAFVHPESFWSSSASLETKICSHQLHKSLRKCMQMSAEIWMSRWRICYLDSYKNIQSYRNHHQRRDIYNLVGRQHHLSGLERKPLKLIIQGSSTGLSKAKSNGVIHVSKRPLGIIWNRNHWASMCGAQSQWYA